MDRAAIYREVAERLGTLAKAQAPVGEAAEAARFCRVASLPEVADAIDSALQCGAPEERVRALLADLVGYCEAAQDGQSHVARLVQAWHSFVGAEARGLPEHFCPFPPAPPSTWVGSTCTPEEFRQSLGERRKAMAAGVFLLDRAGAATARDNLRQHLQVLESKNSTPGLRLFLSAAIAVLDLHQSNAFVSAGVDFRNVIQAVGAGIEEIAQGGTTVAPDVISKLLHALAKTTGGSRRAEKVRQELDLASIRPNLGVLSTVRSDELLALLALSLDLLDNPSPSTAATLAVNFEKLTDFAQSLSAGDAADQCLARALTVLPAAAKQEHDLGDVALACTCVHDAVEARKQRRLDDGWISRLDACAFLLSPGTDKAQLEALREAIVRHGQTSEAHIRTLRAQLLSLLSGVEELFATAIDTRQLPEDLPASLARAAGVFGFLKQEELAALATHCANDMPSAFADESYDRTRLSEQVALLAMSAQGLVNPAQAAATARGWLEERKPTENPDSCVDVPNDPEMLSIFLEELDQIIARLDSNLTPALVGAPASDGRNSNSPVASIRRDFHTVKGGARLILQTIDGARQSHLGELAWHLERAFNRFLDGGLPVSQHLFDLTRRGVGVMKKARDDLYLEARCRIDWSSLSDDVDAVIAGHAPAPAPESMPVLELQVEDAALLVQDVETQVPVLVDEIAEVVPQSSLPELSQAQPVSDTVEAEAQQPLEVAPDEQPIAEVEPQVEAPQALAAPAPAEPAVVLVHGHEVPGWLFETFAADATRVAEAIRTVHAPALWDGPANYELMRAVHTAGSLCESCELLWITHLARTMESIANLLIDCDMPLQRGDREDLVDSLNVLANALDGAAAQAEVAVDTTGSAERMVALLDKLRAANSPAAVVSVIEVAPAIAEPQEAADRSSAPIEASHFDGGAAESTAVHDESNEQPLRMEPAASAPVIAGVASQEQPTETDTEGNAQYILPADWVDVLAVDVSVVDAIDASIMELLAEETAEFAPRASALLESFAASPRETTHINARAEVLRILHTFKGSARTGGAMRLGQAVHQLESWLQLHEGAFDDQSLTSLQRAFDYLFAIAEAYGRGEYPVVGIVSSHVASGDQAAAAPSTAPVAASAPATPAAVESPVPVATNEPVTERRSEPRRMTLKVAGRVIEGIANAADLATILQARSRQALHDLRELGFAQRLSLHDLQALVESIKVEAETKIQSIRDESSDSQFDPLEFDRFTRLQELARMITERVSDVTLHNDRFAAQLDDIDQNEERRSKVNDNLHHNASAAMALPVANLQGRFARLVRQTSEQLGRNAAFNLKGEADVHSSIFERVAGALEHLIRNCIAHGIESPDEREAAGKQRVGQVTLEARHTGSQVEILIQDDGRGIEPARIRAKALAIGLLTEEQAQAMDDLETIQLIFARGLTTADTVNEIAGRGVGMDAVRATLREIGGDILIESEVGKGTTITVSLPTEVSTVWAVPVTCYGHQLMIPIGLVETFVLLEPAQAAAALEAGQVKVEHTTYEVLPLVSRALSIETDPVVPRMFMLATGEKPVAIAIGDHDNFIKIVMKGISGLVKTVPGVLGVSIAADGTPVLVIDPVAFASVNRQERKAPVVQVQQVEPQEKAKSSALTVLVVDDSTTIRAIMTKFLQRFGFVPKTAKDGLDALAKIESGLEPDIILLDIEMPNMDGFTFASRLRATTAWKSVPIIMISSRTADKYREKAAEIGVNAYLPKPYSDKELLSKIQELTGTTAPQHELA